MKKNSFIKNIEISSVEEAMDILNKAGSLEEDIEKARQIGDIHPNGKWVWGESASGKKDWRAIKGAKKDKDGGNAGGKKDDDKDSKTPATPNSTGTTPPANSTPTKPAMPGKPTSAQIASRKAGKPKKMDLTKLPAWAAATSDDKLVNAVNSVNGDAFMRKFALAELKSRNYDISKLNVSGTLQTLNNLAGDDEDGDGGDKPAVPKTPAQIKQDAADKKVRDANATSFKIDGKTVTEKWYLDKKDKRVTSQFDLDTKMGRIGYDNLVDTMERDDPKYVPALKRGYKMNRNFLSFISDPNQRFMIAAGGAGIGKSYGFTKLAELLNEKPFEEGDTPGDGDYGYFEAPNVKSGVKLTEVLKAHNGKIILFDDNDNLISFKDMASIMKNATTTTGKRIISDPNDPTNNFEFTGRIVVLTNKSFTDLSDNESGKALMSRASLKTEIYMTVKEQIEVMENRYLNYEFDQTPRLDDAAEDKKERDEVMKLIKDHQHNIDPKHFTARTFQEILNSKRGTELSNEKVKLSPMFKMFLGDGNDDWREEAIDIISKSDDSQPLGSGSKSFDGIEDYLDTIQKSEIYDREMSLEKAEDLLLGE